MKRTGRVAVTLVTVLLLVLTIACAPTPGEITPPPAPSPEEITPTTPPTPEEVTPPPTPEEVTPPPTPEPAPAPTGDKVNFRFLISDDVNAIQFFERLDVIISSIGVHQDGESGTWYTLDPVPDPDGDGIPGINLRPLEGPNAVVIWEGTLPAGDYTKVFIYVNDEDITGILLDDETANVKLPSQKLQISEPFTISEDQVVNFVYDITVVKAGESGMYILKPQIAQSGPNQEFTEVSPERERERERLRLELEGNVAPGETVTLLVTFEDEPVVGAAVEVNGEGIGTTTDDGTISFTIPEDADRLEIEVKLGEQEGELEIELSQAE